jgi:cell division protein ZapA
LAQVTIKLNGYSYTVGCEDGQEQHLLAMADQVESRIESIKKLGGNYGEARLLVLTALLLADEIHDLRIEMEALHAAAATPPPSPTKAEAETNRRIRKLAARAEQIAADLERP